MAICRSTRCELNTQWQPGHKLTNLIHRLAVIGCQCKSDPRLVRALEEQLGGTAGFQSVSRGAFRYWQALHLEHPLGLEAQRLARGDEQFHRGCAAHQVGDEGDA
jgi:hypothetical protein